MTHEIRFDDGDAYERYMGTWSRLAGATFLEWLSPEPRLRWLDVGCGNGAFTELLVDRCDPHFVHGIDPSEPQLTFARSRLPTHVASFQQGCAMTQPFSDDSFDAAVMPLVIFFVPEPERGVAEMARVVRPGGTVSAYAWDLAGGGLPYESLQAEMRALGIPFPSPPRPETSSQDTLQALWQGAGLEDVATRRITVERTFPDFDDYWSTILTGPTVKHTLADMSAAERQVLRDRIAAILPIAGDGSITCSGAANAIKGRVPMRGAGG